MTRAYRETESNKSLNRIIDTAGQGAGEREPRSAKLNMNKKGGGKSTPHPRKISMQGSSQSDGDAAEKEVRNELAGKRVM